MAIFKATIKGREPGLLMHCGTSGLDPDVQEAKKAITAKRGTPTKDEQLMLREHDCLFSMWSTHDHEDPKECQPCIPATVLRATIEVAARKTKEGPSVREGLTIGDVRFEWDKSLGQTCGELSKHRLVQHQAPVVVQRSRLLRTRAIFQSWWCEFEVSTDESLVDQSRLEQWIELAGQRIGIGDWRPAKSGPYGRFTLDSLELVL